MKKFGVTASNVPFTSDDNFTILGSELLFGPRMMDHE